MTALLEVDQVSVRRGGKQIVTDVSLQLQPGSVHAILGPNGAGKSTLVKAILGLIPIERGHVRVAGQDNSARSLEQRARTTAYVPQQTSLQGAWQVHEVVAMGRYAHRASMLSLGDRDRSAIHSAMQRTFVLHLAERAFDTLSGGERARVMLARALCTEANLLVVDEPTAHLDVRHALDCWGSLRQFASEGRAILAVMHDLNQALEFSDTALLMHMGRAVDSGPTREVLSPTNVANVYAVDMISGGAASFRHASAASRGADG